MTRWEYKWVKPVELSPRLMNELGTKGWELAGALGGDWCIFKRPLVRCLKEYATVLDGITSFKDGDCNCSTCQEGEDA